MNKAKWAAGILILVIALCGAYYFGIREQNSPVLEPDTTVTGNAVVGANGASAIITYSDEGFSPTPQTISPGTTITWVNQSSRMMWIENENGRDSGCQQTPRSFDACEGVGKGGTYSYTFTTLGTFSYVNHTQISDGGTIMVTEASASGPINPAAILQ